mmetsp:Transcript_1637/g.3709  ORF Transcript_1637/g.3709 Transcript_1637/m.3709 type:complete len:81 (+) Transcript_1637:1791-2033(+)
MKLCNRGPYAIPLDVTYGGAMVTASCDKLCSHGGKVYVRRLDSMMNGGGMVLVPCRCAWSFELEKHVEKLLKKGQTVPCP